MVKFKLEYFLARLVGLIARGLPPKAAYLIGEKLGDLFFYVVKIRKNVALKNLKYALGNEKSENELLDIVRQNYRHFGKMLFEFARIQVLKREDVLEEILVINRHILEEALSQGKGVLVLSGHFGNWEYMAAAVAQIGPPLYAVFKAQKNLLVDDLIKQQRVNLGLLPLKVKGGAARGIMTALRQHAKVLIVFDQDAGKNGRFVKFLGRPASTNDGAARIAVKFQIPSVLAFAVRTKLGAIKVIIEKFPEPATFENSDQGIIRFIETYNHRLEHYIRKYPEQYFWMHRRWLAWERIEKEGGG